MTDMMAIQEAATYRTMEVAELSGISYRMLDYWTRAGALRPHVDARGSGTRRIWTAEQAAWVQAIGEACREAERHGVELNVVAIGDIWDALTDGREWEITLRAKP